MADLVRQKIVFAFNQVFVSLVKEVRKNDALRKAMSKNFKIFDPDSDSYITHFIGCVDVLMEAVRQREDFASCIGCEVLRGINLGQLHDVAGSDADRDVVDRYILTLLSITAVASDLNDDNAQDIEGMLNTLLDKLKAIEQDASALDLSDVFDDDLIAILEALAAKNAPCTPVTEMLDEDKAKTDEFLEKMNGSKLGQLAKELAQNIDPSTIKSPEDLMDFSSKNMGSIIKNVTESIQTKIKDGSLTTDELIGEAMEMMKMFGGPNGAMFKNMNKSAMHNATRQHETKSRLRKKLEKKIPTP
jgi:hypothetical protein